MPRPHVRAHSDIVSSATSRRPLIGVTLGDPAGIGPEVVAKAACDSSLRARARIVAIGPAASLTPIASKLDLRVRPSAIDDLGSTQPACLPVLDIRGDLKRVSVGEVTSEAGRLALAALECAVELALGGQIDAITTGPWNKEAIRLAGNPVPGHTEFLAELTNRDPAAVSMMLVHGRLRVFHVSTHVPLRTVFEHVRVERVLRVIRLAHHVLRELGISHPKIAVAGLNPHAGEGGLFGDEDRLEIAPAVAAARGDGFNVTGPMPGDTVFWKALRGDFDGVVAMYHDQGHIPVKVAGMGHGVNVTVGLPIIRTSVDHGTAFDIVGRGVAEPTSMIEAIGFAADLVKRGARLDAHLDERAMS